MTTEKRKPEPAAGDAAALSAAVHELRVHQTELEMQNEELRGAQLELQESHEKYFELFDLAPVGYLTLSDIGSVGDANLTAARLLGVERQSLVGQPFNAFVLATDGDVYYLHQRMLQQTGEPQTCELRLRRVGGEPFWAHLEWRLERAVGDEPPSCWVTFTDIDEHKRAEGALRESVAHYRLLAENIKDVVWILDTETMYFRYVSPSVEGLRGFTPEEILAEPVTQALTAEAGAYITNLTRRRVEDVLAGREPADKFYTQEVEQPCKDGSTVWTEAITSYYVNPQSGRMEVRGVTRDITARRQADEEIRRLNAELEERVVTRTAQRDAFNHELEAFAYSAAHDLRAPLRAIDGFSEMLVEDAAERLTPDELQHLERVRAAAQRMAQMIDDLMGLSKLTRRPLLRRRVDVSATAREVTEELRAAQPRRRVELIITPGMTTAADPALLRLVLAQLLDNAWKFTSKHDEARIEVGVTDADGERAFFVRDDGAGFNMGHAKQLFGAFQRFHAAGEFEGDGMGLAIAQRLVLRHGGRVWAEAEVEKGATFFFTLPEAELASD